MSTRIVCPDCGDRLKLHKPAIDSTRVKCRNCGAKFYAGKAENWTEEGERAGGFHPLPGANSFGPSATAAVIAEPESTIEEPPTIATDVERRRHRHRIEHTKTPRWAMPLGIAAVLGIALAGIFLGQTPAVPEVPNSPSNPEKAVAKTTPLQPDTAITNSQTYRPQELIGVWETKDVPGGRLDIAADGTIHVRGAFLNEEKLDLMSRWFTVRVHGDNFVIEIGPEPRLTSNHGMRLIRQPDGSLVLTRYATVAALNIQERRFTKVQ